MIRPNAIQCITRTRPARFLGAGVAATLTLPVLLGSAAPAAAQAASGNCTPTSTTTTCTFTAPGGVPIQTWTVPAGVTSASFGVFGAQGGRGCVPQGVAGSTGQPDDAGGLGGEAKATLPVSAGEVVQIGVGGAGGDAICDNLLHADRPDNGGPLGSALAPRTKWLAAAGVPSRMRLAVYLHTQRSSPLG